MNDPKHNSASPYGAPGVGPGGERPASLIERAVGAFNRQEFVPPSLPSDMLPSTLNPAGYPARPGQPLPQGGGAYGAPSAGAYNPAGWLTGQASGPQAAPQSYPGAPPYPAPQGQPGQQAQPVRPAPAAQQGNPYRAEPAPGWARTAPAHPAQPAPSAYSPGPAGFAQPQPGAGFAPGQPAQHQPLPGGGFARPAAAPYSPQGAPLPGMAPAGAHPGQGHPGQGHPAFAAEGPGAPRALSQGYYPIDRRRLHEAGMLGTEAASASQLEEFRIVKRQIIEQADDMRRRGGGGAAQRVMVCSSHAGEGKTFCAVNLAMSISAEKESEVLLVDFDLARSSVLQLLGLPPGPGLMDALVDPTLDVRRLVMQTDVPGLSVLPGGRPTNSDTEYLASSRSVSVLDQLTEGAPQRIVLFDSPPALAASIPAELAKLMGQVVLVVLADSTPSGAVQDAASLLSGCPNVQLLLNSVQFSANGRRFGSYHGYRG